MSDHIHTGFCNHGDCIDDECPHGMASPEWCSICKHGVEIAEPLKPMAFGILARYEGQCPTCDFPIRKGQRIRRWSDDLYRHLECYPEGAA